LWQRKEEGISEVILVDETELKLKQGTLYVWLALEPYNKILLGFSITSGRIILEYKLTFLYWFRCWGTKPKLVLTDGGKWYSVLDRLGVIWIIYSGIRSYIDDSLLLLKVIVGFIMFVLYLSPLSCPRFLSSLGFPSSLYLCSIIPSTVSIHQTLGRPQLGRFVSRRGW